MPKKEVRRLFIARQPIFNQNLDVYGYELLYRSDSKSTQFDGVSSQIATANVIGGLFESGIERIVENRRAFINFDEDFIHSNSLELIDSDRLVIEMLENIKIDNDLIERLKYLKDKGYKIALDDFIEEYKDYPLIPLADIIKFDLIATPLETIKSDVDMGLAQNKILLAEKIETKEEFLEAKEMGFHLFQGYFFSKPSIAGKSCDKTTAKIQYIRLLQELKKEEPSYQALAEIIEKDINLAYRLMRVVSGRSSDELVYSIKKALTFMGLKEIERWVNILMIRDLGESKPMELMKISLIRTRFAETIALHGELKSMKDEASMMGLFSTLDAMLDQTMEEALRDMPFPESIVAALVHGTGILYPIYELIIAYEKGDWENALYLSKRINVDVNILYEEYLDAIKWANDILKVMI